MNINNFQMINQTNTSEQLVELEPQSCFEVWVLRFSQVNPFEIAVFVQRVCIIVFKYIIDWKENKARSDKRL